MTTRQRYNNYINGQGFCCTDKTAAGFTTLDSNIGNGNDDPEKLIFFYHSDHLGSTSYVTNLDGNVVQHVEYIPFGEVFIEERNNVWNTPYLFNSKELDEETGLYYYGARYYNPRESVWLSVDPLVEKTGTPYQYCYQNPVKFVDMFGMEGTDIYEMDKQGNLIWRAESARDVIYTSDQFKDGNLISGSKGYDIGDKGYIAESSGKYNSSDFIKFSDFDKAAGWFDWLSKNSFVEFSLQGFNGILRGGTTESIYTVTTNHNLGSVSSLSPNAVNQNREYIYMSPQQLFDVHFHPGSEWDFPSGMNDTTSNSVNWNTNEIYERGSYSLFSGGDMTMYGKADMNGKPIPANSYMYNNSNQKVLQYGQGGLLGIYPITTLKKK